MALLLVILFLTISHIWLIARILGKQIYIFHKTYRKCYCLRECWNMNVEQWLVIIFGFLIPKHLHLCKSKIIVVFAMYDCWNKIVTILSCITAMVSCIWTIMPFAKLCLAWNCDHVMFIGSIAHTGNMPLSMSHRMGQKH